MYLSDSRSVLDDKDITYAFGPEEEKQIPSKHMSLFYFLRS